MAQIRLENVSFGYTDALFEDVTVTIGDNDRIGIVGHNGSGKSTLLKCIAGLIEPTKGRIVRPKSLSFGFMEQDIPAGLRDSNLYNVISDAIPESERDYNTWKVELSGGWQRLALIARIGLSEPDVLLLDEPTNHLDVGKIFVLEQWLNEQVYNIPLIAVSHDRSFLSHCTSKTLFVRGSKVHEYNYSYEIAKDLLAEDDKTASAQRTKELKEIDRLERSAHELRQIGVNNRSDAALKKSTQIAKRAKAIGQELTETHVEKRRDIKLGNSGIQAKKLIALKNIDVRAPDGVLLFHIDKLDIGQDERLVILGLNGCGKSQFLQHLYRAFANIEVAKLTGISITPSAKLGFIDQHLSHMPLQQTLRDYVAFEYGLDNQKTTSVLVNAGFSMLAQNAKISTLSHGQRARVALLGLNLTKPNFYIMDEPTNHLDIAGQEQLESEILEHGASSIFASHDRVFVENIGTTYYVINNQKLVPIDSPAIFYAAITDAPDEDGVNRSLNLKKSQSTPRPS